MSLITSCPACGTMFRVVPDQLKISEGWVRCGHCAEIFDATAHLADEVEEEEASGPAAAAPPGRAPVAGDEGFTGWESTAAGPLSTPAPLAAPPVRPAPPVQPAPPAPSAAPVPAAAVRAPIAVPETEIPVSRFGPDSQSLEPSALDAPFVFRRSDFVEPDPVPSVLPPLPPPGDSRLPLDDDEEHEHRPELPQVSFVRQARRKAFWRRPLVRVLLTLVSLGLAGLLLLQAAWQDRDRLAAMQPQLRPALEQMCAWLQCTLGPPRQIESIVIESSGFNRLRGDTYRLSFTLRNGAPMRVAAPSMELTLTDTQDQPLLRRVLSPAELGAVDGVIPAQSEWAGSVGVVVNSSNATRVAGYRLLAFYP